MYVGRIVLSYKNRNDKQDVMFLPRREMIVVYNGAGLATAQVRDQYELISEISVRSSGSASAGRRLWWCEVM